MTDRDNETGDKVLDSDEDGYAAEWAKEDTPEVDDEISDSAQAQGADTDSASAEEKAKTPDDLSGAEVRPGEEASPTGDLDSSAESGSDDIWANASPAQIAAFKRSQNNAAANAGRLKKARGELAHLQGTHAVSKAQLDEMTREKGAYEIEHPELFKEVEDHVRRTLPTSQSAPDPTEPVASEDDIALVLATHEDAPEILASDEWSQFLDNASKEQLALANSDQPEDFIALIDQYKAIPAPVEEDKEVIAPKGSGLSETVAPSKSSVTVPNVKPSSGNSYEDEWAKDDDDSDFDNY